MLYEEYYGLTLYEIISKARDTYADQILFSYMRDGEVVNISYNGFLQDVCKVAYALSERRLEGRYIVIEGKTEYELIVAQYAAVSVGAIAFLLNLDLPEAEIDRALNCTKPGMIICSADNYDVVENYCGENDIYCIQSTPDMDGESIRSWLDTDGCLYEYRYHYKPEDPALVLMTSGSTSQSKLVLLSHYVYLPIQKYMTDKNILIFPMYHIAGIVLVNNCIIQGIRLCLSDMKVGIRDMEWFQPTEIVAVPAFISFLVNRNKQNSRILNGVKGITSLGAPQNLEVAKYLNTLGIFACSAYGATETGGAVGFITLSDYQFGTVGKPAPWNEVKIAENGEILVKGKNVMLEYIGNPQETQDALKDGWYHTGDVGYLDDDGHLHITGRTKNVIILSNGENVSPEALEAQLHRCTAIEEVVVYGEDDIIAAHVWCGGKADESVRKSVNKYISQFNRSVPSYHNIRKVVFREEPFPKTAAGKIKR